MSPADKAKWYNDNCGPQAVGTQGAGAMVAQGAAGFDPKAQQSTGQANAAAAQAAYQKCQVCRIGVFSSSEHFYLVPFLYTRTWPRQTVRRIWQQALLQCSRELPQWVASQKSTLLLIKRRLNQSYRCSFLSYVYQTMTQL